jgi:succinate-acetate transporter protein
MKNLFKMVLGGSVSGAIAASFGIFWGILSFVVVMNMLDGDDSTTKSDIKNF